jgi:RNA polymerase sigma-70 factor, ECF subfamily
MSLARWALAWPTLDRRRVPIERHRRVRELLRAHADAVWRTAQRVGVSASDIEDVVQDVMLVVLRRLDDIAPDKERAFLVGTTVRVAANRRRRQRRHPEHSLDGDGDSPLRAAAPSGQALARGEQSVETTRQLALLQAALAEMTPEQRDTFVLFELEELSAREAAEQLGVTEATIVSRVRRAREVLWAVCERCGYPHGARTRSIGLAEVKP